ncbi:hypothetical protein [uncultured Salipiger sp.]|uniref:hypothetical protein n=1 Tax=uncultured Salipiger sp. TaxID=499810 RepID=UPI002599EF6A|nr:hypothetical protein [uncultured Salipiger sp.]
MNKLIIGGAVALALSSTHLSAAPIHAFGDLSGIGSAPIEQIWLAKGNGNNGKGNGNGGGNKKLSKQGQGNGGKGGKGNGNAQAGKGNGNGNAKPGNGNAKADKGPDHASNGKPGKGNGNGNAGKPEHAGGPKPKANGNRPEHASNGNGNRGKDRKAFTKDERETVVKRIVSTPAPAGRDMARVLGATALALATPQLVVADVPEDELITYRNCPPGLAKKDPPCVPPGFARDGMSYDDWASYDRDGYDELWRERRGDWLGRDFDVDPDPDYLLLQSDEIARLFDLDPAPRGQRYGLIDGMPVLLDDDDYRSLLLVNRMARVADLSDSVPIAPTAALTQDELRNLYRLPRLQDGDNYAVLNGQIVQLGDSEYELLQMLRIARAVL